MAHPGRSSAGCRQPADRPTRASTSSWLVDPIGEPRLELGLAREGQDDWAPPGWLVLVGPGLNLGEQGGPVLVSVLDESVVRLSAPESR